MTPKPPPNKIYSDLCELCYLVGTFGSSHHASWWNCSFLSPSGLETLAFNFPRTSVSSAVTATSRAAAIKHDQAAGAVGVFHLFRLPPGMQEKVHQHLIADGSSFGEILAQEESCKEALRNLAEGTTPDGGGLGPGARNLGEFAPDDKNLIALLAASYLAAFTEGYETFPYFTFA